MKNKLDDVKEYSQKIVLQAIVSAGPISRASLSKQTGLSKQTISEVVRKLESKNWVKVSGQTKGKIGRTAITYELNSLSSGVVVIDLGGTKVHIAITDLFGQIICEKTEFTHKNGGLDLVKQIVRIVKSLISRSKIKKTLIQVVSIGVPGVPDELSGSIKKCPNIKGLDKINFKGLIEEKLNIKVLLDNDVNLAALGEHLHLWKNSNEIVSDNLVFIAIGTGIGSGVIVNGDLVRGFKGAAGELAYLPIGSEINNRETKTIGALERATATKFIKKRYNELTRKNKTVIEIFNLAEKRDPVSIKIIDEIAYNLAKVVSVFSSILDTEKIVFGGSIGVQKILVDKIKFFSKKIISNPPSISISQLGTSATLVGAIQLALEENTKSFFSNNSISQFNIKPKVLSFRKNLKVVNQ